MRRVFLIGLASLPLLAACTLPGEAPPAPPPVQVVFFTEDSAALDEAAQGVVAQVARAAQAQPGAPVQVLGFADPDGGRAYNQALSAARAENVAAALRAQGIAPARIRVAPRGPVPFEMMPLESRRVEIRIGQEQVTP
ncbi:OmpA family protein [Pseudoroseomonas cervicalis]|uniref:OmpA family protein n=1 Tax=Pseudoroseomonas cervicalis ATCC 49957 TaxID=525371 RepID=D5RQF4_9PROT|nr:OmpA family protein [Pseudoroseomonas cervicalis]EFH10457.1 OmpA family protein [Pseudoroseomonas cervicalis ATCC 49957]